MNPRRYIQALIICFFLAIPSFSQRHKVDSLKRALFSDGEAIGKVETLNALSFNFYTQALNVDRLDSCYTYAQQALALSRKIRYPKGEAHALINIGCYHADKDELRTSDSLFREAAKIANRIGDKKLIGLSWHGLAGVDWYNGNNKAALQKYNAAVNFYREAGEEYFEMLVLRVFTMLYNSLGDYSEALRYAYTALRFFEKTKDTAMVIDCYQNMSLLNCEQKDYREALKNNEKAITYLRIFDRSPANGHSFYLPRAYVVNGDIFLGMKEYENALKNYSEAAGLYKSTIEKSFASKSYLWAAYIGIGNVYEARGDSLLAKEKRAEAELQFDGAYNNYAMALALAKENLADFDDLGLTTRISIGSVNIKRNRLREARKNLEDAMGLARTVDSKQSYRDIYFNFSKLFQRMGDFKQAYAYEQKYIVYRDSLVNEESIRKSDGYKTLFEFEKKEDEIKLLTAEREWSASIAQAQKRQKEIAYVALGLILGLGGYGFLMYRRKRKIQVQQELTAERLRISSELHDEVGATLSGVSMYSHLIKEQMKKGEVSEMERSLSILQQTSGEMVNKLNDIVWLINPEQDSLKKLVERLEEYARNMAAIKKMNVQVTVPKKIEEISLPVDCRRNIYLFCKEAINNAVKYSEGDRLELVIAEKKNGVEFSVLDNGRGFDAVLVRRGNGLDNMQKRADEIGGTLTLHSKQNEGVRVSIQYKTG